MDLQPRDLSLLVSLEVLLAERSVTLAARRLGISQPAMSAQLARLRRLMGDELLVGHAHGMTLTPRAEELRAPLATAIEELRGLVRGGGGFDPARDSRHFRIAGSDLSLSVLLPRLLPRLAAEAPGVTIEAVPLDIEAIAGGMERGEAEFAITSAENAPQNFPARLLAEESFRVIWRRGHPQLDGPPSLAQFCRLRHVVAGVPGSGSLDDADAALARRGLARDIGLRVPNFLLVPPVIRASDMIAVVPARLAEAQPEGIGVGPPPLDLPGFRVYLSWHRRLHRDAACMWLRRLVSEVAGDPASPADGPGPA